MFLYDESTNSKGDNQQKDKQEIQNNQTVSGQDLNSQQQLQQQYQEQDQDLQIVNLEEDDNGDNDINLTQNQKPKRRQQRNLTKQINNNNISPLKQRQENLNQGEIQLNQDYKTNLNNQEQIFEPGQDEYQQDGDLPVLQKLDDKFKIQENDQKLLEIQKQQQLKLKQELEQKVEQSAKNTQIQKQNQNNNQGVEDEQIMFSEDSDDNSKSQKQDSNQKNQKKQEDIIVNSSEEDEEEEDGEEEEEDQQQQQQNEKENKNDIEQFSSDSENEEENKNNININPSLSNSQVSHSSQQRVLKLFTKEMLKIGSDEIMRNFLTTPVVKGYKFECYVQREKSGLNVFKNKKYHFYMGDVLLMSAKKMSGSKTPNFYIIQQNMENIAKADDFKKDSIRFLGKLKGENFIGSKFHIYDTGLSYKHTKNPDLYRRELGYIVYDHSILGSAAPTKMTCLLPQVDFKTHVQSKEFLGQTKEDSMKQLLKQKNFTDLKYLHTKPPLYNSLTKTYYLDFGSRVKKQSVKNYQLIDDSQESSIYLTSGRSDDNDIFICDFQFPFTPLQAFCVCVSGLTYKP